MKKQFLKLFALLFAASMQLLQADSTPTMSRVYGNQFTPQVADTQSAAAIGTLDGTFGTGGMLDVSAQMAPNSTSLNVLALSDGTFVTVLDNGTNSALVKYTATGTVDTFFGSSGVCTLTNLTNNITSGAVNLGLILDAQNRFLVSGSANTADSNYPWIRRITADGTVDSSFSWTDGAGWLGLLTGLAEQSTGKIIATGFNGTNGQIARYNLDGSLDTAFGSSGFIILNGSGSLPESISWLINTFIDSSDNVYVAFVASTTASGFTATQAYIARFTAEGAFDTTWGTSGVVPVAALNGASDNGIYLAKNNDGNLIAAGQVGSNIIVTGVTSSGGSIGGFTTFNSSVINGHAFAVGNVVTTSDNGIFIVGADTDVAAKNMAVIKLVGSTGALDTAFNGTGYNVFNDGRTSRTDYVLFAGTIAPDGQLYTAGYGVSGGVSLPYISRLNNMHYVSQVAQSPVIVEQGILDATFGTAASQTYAGVTTPFNGLYGSSMMQRVQSMVEVTTTSGAGGTVPAVGDIIVGMHGKTNTSANSNMMLSWLTSAGAIDTAAANSGYLTLANSLTNEYLTSILQGPAGIVYVAGYASDTDGGASTGALLRAYSSSSTTDWTSGAAAWSATETTAGYQGLAVGYQASATRALLFVKESSTVGHITAYNSSGALDTTWGAASSGTIAATSYGLHMGPVYGGLITDGDSLIVAYKDSSSGLITCPMFIPDGSALQSNWGTAGVTTGLFAGVTTVAAANVRVCFNGTGSDVIVAAINGAGTSLLFTRLDAVTGAVDTTFGTSGVLTVAVSGSTALSLQEVVGISDGMILVTFYDNATDDTMYLARITNAGALDTTFNSQGSQPGILPIQIGDKVANYNARVATAALVQSTAGANQGNIVVAGYESVTANDATPMVMSSYGTLGTTEIPFYPLVDTSIPGTFDVAYNENTALSLGSSAAKVVCAYPGGNTYQGYMLMGYDNGTTCKIARIDISTNTLDTSFGTAGVYTIAGSLDGISTLSLDAQNNILVGGTTTGGTAWAQQISVNGSSAITCTMPTSGSFAITQISQILQQQSGRYIVAGSGTDTSGAAIGVVIAFQDTLVSPATTLVVDPTFNPLANGLVPAGTFVVNTTATAGTPGVYSIAINSDDTILAVYKNITPVMAVAKIAADGSGLVSSGFGSSTFGISGTLVTTIVPDSSAVCRVAIDSLNNVVAAASCGSGTTVKIVRYDATGTTSQFTNGGIVSGNIATITNAGSAGVVLSDMMQTTSQQAVLLGYNSAGGNGRLFAVRLGSNGQLSSTWNPSSAGTDTAGVLTFATNSVTVMNGSSICIDGTIVAVGQQAGGTSGDPIVMYVYGDTYVTQVAQNPLQAAAGTLDSTIPSGSTGAAALSGTITGVPQKVAILNNDSNGGMYVGSSDGTNSYVTLLNADLTLGTYGTSGVVTLTGQGTLHDMYVTASLTSNTAAPVYATGSQGGAMWAAQINAAGSSTVYVATGSALTTGNVIRQTTNSRILVAGYNGTSGAIAAFGAVPNGESTFALDTSFGNGSGTGVYTTGVATQIYDMAVDPSDRIYIAYKNGSAIIVQRLLANGTAVDSTFSATFTTAINSYSASQVRLTLDMTNDQLIVAAQDGTSAGNIIELQRFSTVDGSDAGAISTVTLAGSVLNLSDLFIDSLQNIYVVGYTNAGNAIVARVASTSSTTIALDTTYATASATPGVATLAAGSMSVVTAGAYDPDRRTYVVGSNGSTAGYIARVFGDVYTSQVSQAISNAVVGSIDTTLYPNFTGGIDLSAQAGWSSLSGGYKAQAIIENSNGDGSSFIAFGNGTDVYVGKVNADMVPVTSFGLVSNGLTNGYTMPVINSISLDAAGNILVAGTNGGAQKVLSFSSAGVRNATFAAPIVASTVGNVVAQQKSGRYLVAGYDGSANGLVSAYKNLSAVSAGALPVDPTFGPNGNDGYFATGVAAPIDDMVIDSNDYVYIVYRNGSNVINIAKLTPQGSLVTSANSPSAQNWSTNPVVATDITATDTAHIAINQAGNILIGASTASGIQIRLYNGSTGVAIAAAQTVTSSSSPVLTKLVGSIAASNEFYGTFYTSTPAAGVFAVTSAGLVDTAGFGTAGITTTTVQTPQQVKGLSIQFDGKVVAVGYNNAGAGSTADPILLRLNGYPYISQQAQEPDLVAAGNLDTTLWPTTGALELDTYAPISTTITTLGGSSVARIYEYSNGQALILFSNTNSGSDCVLARVNKDLTLDTTFNTVGYITISGKTNATSLFVDSLNNIFVAGGASTSWTRAYTNDGTVQSGWSNPVANLAHGAYQVVLQSNNRVIIAGQGLTNGTLLGYTTLGDLDTSFGNPDTTGGMVDMGGTDPITGCCVDSYDNIITVSTTSGSTILQKVSASGLTVTTLTGGTAISSATGNARVILNQAGKIIVASATSTGLSIRAYTDNNNGTVSDFGTAIAITFANCVLGSMYATNDGKVVAVGYQTTSPYNVLVARLTSAVALDTTFNAPTGYVSTAIGSLHFQANDASICADDRIMIGGSDSVSVEPYLGRIFGDTYVSYVSQGNTLGVAGTLNTTFGDTTPPTGTYDVSTLNGLLSGAQGKVILPLSDGGYYAAFDTANSAANSILIKSFADGSLDTTYNNSVGGAIAGIAGSATSPTYAPLGVNSLLVDGANKVLLVGSTGGAGWAYRYASTGVVDTFGTSGQIAVGTSANVAVEQTLGRYVIAGGNGAGGALFAYTSLNPSGTPGTVDTTFNSVGVSDATGGTTPGIFKTNTTYPVYTLVADAYDRLIYAVLNDAGTAVDLYRLTPTGEYDVTFGASGKVASALTSVNIAAQIRIALDAAGNIIVAATSSTANTFSVAAYNNGTSVVAGGNGSVVYAQLNTSSLTNSPAVTGLTTSADGYALIVGTQSGVNNAWIARITSGGALDTAGFNPAGTPAGIFQYSTGAGSTSHVYKGIAVDADGTLRMIGYENSAGAFAPTVVAVYNDPYTSQQSQSPDAKAVGTFDLTLGVSSTWTSSNKGITFFGSGSSAAYGQVAQAIALYNDNNILVAMDGGNGTSSNSSIFLNMFDNDGILNPNFGTAGQATVLQGSASPVSPDYQNQYVTDMVTFTTAAGVHKALLAGYVQNTTLGTYDSLLLQYNTTPGASGLDTANFGGYSGSPAGIAFGDGKQAFVVGQQSTGRIIVGGLSQDDLGLLLGYSSTGKLDNSFGNNGYQSTDTGTTGIYTHAIDTQNRVVIAYNDGSGAVAVGRFLADGSGLDSSFTSPTPFGAITGNTNLKVAVDSSNQVIVGAINSTNSLLVNTYAVTGGAASVTGTITATQLGNASGEYVMSKLMVDAQSNVIVVMYDTNLNEVVVARLTSALILDTTFNTTGYIRYQVAGGTASNVAQDAMIHPDGRILVVGSEA